MSGATEAESGRARPLSGGLWTLFSWLRRDDRSSTESVSSAGSDRTVASFAFLAPALYGRGGAAPARLPPPSPPSDSYRRRVRERSLRRQRDRDLTLHRKYGLYGLGFDGSSLPASSGRRPEERDRRAASESPRAHVPGKRRAPPPPTAHATLPRRRARKRPAPLPPSPAAPRLPAVRLYNLEPMNRLPVADERPPRGRDDATGCKPQKYSKKDTQTKETKDVKVRQEKSFLKQIFENKKRNSAIETASVKLLPNISELDKQAAEMIEKYRLKEMTPSDDPERRLGKNESTISSKQQPDAWICTRCLRKYDSSVITCDYCLPLNKSNDSYKSSKVTNCCTQTKGDPSCVASASLSANIEDKEKLKEILKEMKDSLPKRPKSEFISSSKIKNNNELEIKKDYTKTAEAPTLRIGSSIYMDNKPLVKASTSGVKTEKSNSQLVPQNINKPNSNTLTTINSVIITKPVVLVHTKESNVVLNDTKLNKENSDRLQINKDNTDNKDSSNENDTRTNKINPIPTPLNIISKTKYDLNTPLKISSLLNPIYIPKTTSTTNTEAKLVKQVDQKDMKKEKPNTTKQSTTAENNLTMTVLSSPQLITSTSQTSKNCKPTSEIKKDLDDKELALKEKNTQVSMINVKPNDVKTYNNHANTPSPSVTVCSTQLPIANVRPIDIKTHNNLVNTHSPTVAVSSSQVPIANMKPVDVKTHNNLVNTPSSSVPVPSTQVSIANMKPIGVKTHENLVNTLSPSVAVSSTQVPIANVRLIDGKTHNNLVNTHSPTVAVSSTQVPIANMKSIDVNTHNNLMNTPTPSVDMPSSSKKDGIDKHARRRDLINQLERSIAKGDEKAAAEAAVKLAQLKLSCSVLSFSSQIVAEASSSSLSTPHQIIVSKSDNDSKQIEAKKVQEATQKCSLTDIPLAQAVPVKETIVNALKLNIDIHNSEKQTVNKNVLKQSMQSKALVLPKVESAKPTQSTLEVTNTVSTNSNSGPSEASTSKDILHKKEENDDRDVPILVWVEDKESTRGPVQLHVRRGARVGELRRQAERSLGLAARLQRWIVGRALCSDDSAPLADLAGPDLSAPFYLCLVESDTKSGQKPQVALEVKEDEDPGNVYNELVKLEKQPLVENAEAFECGVCIEECLPGSGVVLRECVHSFCKECLSDAVRHSEEPAVGCPATGCRGALQEREIRGLVSPADYERWLARGLAAAESGTRNAFHCRTRDCAGWALCEPGVRRFPCPVCARTNCVPCQAIHEGESCEQHRTKLESAASPDASQADEGTRALLNSLISRGEALECPECSAIITKKWGCDWIKCSACKTEICWVTRGRRWGPAGRGDTSGGCRCGVDGKKCHPSCGYCH